MIGVLCRARYVDSCHGNCGWSISHLFSLQCILGHFKWTLGICGLFAWHSSVNLFLNYLEIVIKCVTLWSYYLDIGIWQRLLDFYFVNDHFNGLCIFTEENCSVQLITLHQKTGYICFTTKVTQHETVTFFKLYFCWNSWTFSLIFIKVCF